MSSVNGTRRKYSISMSPFQRAHVIQLHQQANAIGLGQQCFGVWFELV